MVTRPKEKPKAIETNPLQAAAMLVSVSNHKWGNRKSEQEIADETAKDNEAEEGSFRVTKRLVGKEVTTKLTSAFSAVKTYYYKRTLPWGDDKYRILPSAVFEEFIEEIRKLQAAARAEVEHFIQAYEAAKDAAKKRLGKAYRESDYPNINDMRRKWSTTVHFMPLPSKADFRADIPKAELELVRTTIDEHVKASLEIAQADMFKRLFHVVVQMRDKLKEYSVEDLGKGKKKVHGAFRDSAVNNVKELCELLPKLNFTNNPKLAMLAEEVAASLGAQDPEQLRDDDKARVNTIEDADALLDKMKEFMGE